ncbi:putative aromatic amino acid aminotransferase [Aspergillus clavatus NRRL 1]|uniref:Aromatic amino acid aminotransferase, putative n=1 Tax=Aspergillus clavatus (strain ATCC 1007 / CBS 513.65 / DSM 816 / NCTC 3887 / NRRL 1 / QM 1276 / 107) TaxID=344612 RepID=A1C539_ASPCL|nr:aromatic amino acid aminotransferase, putative [Aspergillus clavatus NRRL 1]EAW14807.1 aromatic amino acid aminotransferase, putative [Aspergillus clavatus NRRL 1]
MARSGCPKQSAPLDLSHHFSQTTIRRESSNLKRLYKYFVIPGMGNLAGGMPHASYFPYDTLEATAARPQRFEPTANDTLTARKNSNLSIHMTVPKECQTDDLEKKIDITTALQYSTAEGLPPMASFVRKFTRDHLHPNVPYAGGPDTLLSCGATDGFNKVIETFTAPWSPERDWVRDRQAILCEEYVYMNPIQTVRPRGLNVASVAIDAQGMLAYGKGGLADVLENWDYHEGRRPHLLYTITIGQNPTGGTMSVQRRKEIYALCQRYDIIIVEDDPYWNLQYPSAQRMAARYRNIPIEEPLTTQNYNAHGKSSGYQFLDSLVPSFLSLDADGRVIRLDTFSKTVAPGCRLGWITAQPAFIERITRLTETSTQNPSGFVQAMVSGLIIGQPPDKKDARAKDDSPSGWQMDGWVRWLEGLRGAYERRMQSMCSVLEECKYIIHGDGFGDAASNEECGWEVIEKVQMYDFSWPMGGMFVWIKVLFNTHPLYQKYSMEKLSKALWVHLTQEPYLCLLVPGDLFAPTPKSMDHAWQYFRLCFAPMPDEEVAVITNRLVDGFRAFWQRKNLDGLDDIEELSQKIRSLQAEGVSSMMGIGC